MGICKQRALREGRKWLEQESNKAGRYRARVSSLVRLA